MKILIIGPSWIGDMVMAQSLFKELRVQHPDCAIDVLAPNWSAPLLVRMPEVNRVIDMPIEHGVLNIRMRYRLGRQFKATGYDQAIVLPNSFKSALAPFFAGIPKRTGWRGEMRYGVLNDVRILNEKNYPLMAQRFVALACEPNTVIDRLPRPKLSVNATEQQQVLNKFNLNLQTPILVLCPGAEFGEAKRWPTQYYAQVASEKITQGFRVWIMGSQNDSTIAQSIRNQLSHEEQKQCINLAGRTTLAEAIDLMDCATVMLSNDSGLMHIGSALNKPMVVVYGSTSPDFTPPLHDKARIENLKLPCSPCFKRECPLKHMNCLNQLMPEQVLVALNSVEHL
jgi:heptosyltransferase-2